jgi:hypothetical protein
MTLAHSYYHHAPPDQCGTPDCDKPRVEGRYVCAEHAPRMDRIRTEFQEAAHKKIHYSKRPPTCCFPGCYELRPRNSAFCFKHSDQVEET